MIALRRLHAFVAIARLVRGLEAELGANLLRRLPRGVELTDAGRALLDETRIVLARSGLIAGTGDIHAQAFEEVLFLPLGQSFQPTAMSRQSTDAPPGMPLFWNIQRV